MNARANEPNPPRVTVPEPASDEVADTGALEEEASKKLLRDDHDPWPLPDQKWRDAHGAACGPEATPGGLGPQFSFGISA